MRQRLNRTPSERETNEDRGKECQGLMRFGSVVVLFEFCRLIQRGAACQGLSFDARLGDISPLRAVRSHLISSCMTFHQKNSRNSLKRTSKILSNSKVLRL